MRLKPNHGSLIWTGEWGSNSPNWTEERKREVGYDDTDIFMGVADFKRSFSTIWSHHLPDGLYQHEVLLKGKWTAGRNGGYRSSTNPQFLCHAAKDGAAGRAMRVQCELIIPFSTYNENSADLMLNMSRGEGGNPITDININNTISASMHTFTKAVHLETQLTSSDQGGFVLIPTFGNRGQSLTGDFRIIIRSDSQLRVRRIQ